MYTDIKRHCTAFQKHKRVARGTVLEVASAVKKYLEKKSDGEVLIFDDLSSAPVEIDLRGSAREVVKRLQEAADKANTKVSGPGRPKLGVVSREISLLPRHWEWLSLQPSGASATLRRLVEETQKKNLPQDQMRQAQTATYKFMHAVAGDLPHYEEALRALFASDKKAFTKCIATWPKDIVAHIEKLAADRRP